MSVLQDYASLVVAASLIPLSIKVFSFLIPRARAWGLLDRPGGRHIHSMPVAVVGGIGVMVTWLVGLCAVLALSPVWARANTQEIAVVLLCAATVLAIGIADDSVGITPKARLFGEIAVASLSVAFVPSVHQFCLELSESIGWTVYPLTTIGIVGVMNSMNLVDGMDGLAGCMFFSLSLAVTFLASPFGHDPSFGSVSAVLLIPGLLAFLRKNWNPAATFMGDHGSLCVGYLLVTSALGIRSSGGVHGLGDIAMLAALFSYPVLDMLICMARRFRLGQPVATGDRNHMHHRMLRLGLSVRESVGGLIAWQVAMLCPVFLVRAVPPSWTPLVLLASLAVAGERLLLLGRIESARVRQYQSRIYGLLKPRGLPQVDSAFVHAHICVPLRPMIEAAQFEERGCLEQMVESLRFFCERKVKGHGFVKLGQDELVVSLVGSPQGATTPEELRREWSEELKIFSQAFRLTYSTWALPVHVKVAGKNAVAGSDDADGASDADDGDSAIDAA